MSQVDQKSNQNLYYSPGSRDSRTALHFYFDPLVVEIL